MFERSQKGLPHAILHATELVETYGHHGACCTCVAEAGHKTNIKQAAKFSRTYASKNTTQEGMLTYVQRQHLWTSVLQLHKAAGQVEQPRSPIPASSDDSADGVPLLPGDRRAPPTQTLVKLMEPLGYTSSFNNLVPNARGRPPAVWGGTFLL